MTGDDALRDIFNHIDEDGDGTLTLAEVTRFCGAFPTPARPGEAELRALMGSGEVSQSDFCRVAAKLEKSTGLSRDEMAQHFTTQCHRELFAAIDLDSSGEISRHELRHLIESTGMKVSDEELRKMFVDADRDESGAIDSDEFCAIASRLAFGMPLSRFIQTFLAAERERRERMERKRQAFGGGGWFRKQPAAPPAPPPAPPPATPPADPIAPDAPVPASRRSSARGLERRMSVEEAMAVLRLPSTAGTAQPSGAQRSRSATVASTLSRSTAPASATERLHSRGAPAVPPPATPPPAGLPVHTPVTLDVHTIRGSSAAAARSRASSTHVSAPAASRATEDSTSRVPCRSCAALREQLHDAEEKVKELSSRPPQPASDDSHALALQEVWALQTALELRTQELERLRTAAMDFAATASRVQPGLGDGFAAALQTAQKCAEADERAAFGGDLARDAVGAATRARAAADHRSASKAASAEPLAAAERRSSAERPRQSDGVPRQIHAQSGRTSGAADASEAVAALQVRLAESEEIRRQLDAKLERTQAALLAGLNADDPKRTRSRAAAAVRRAASRDVSPSAAARSASPGSEEALGRRAISPPRPRRATVPPPAEATLPSGDPPLYSSLPAYPYEVSVLPPPSEPPEQTDPDPSIPIKYEQ
eukprot:TRINITY_DN26308_c0_g1_i1.p1 TRINITY_DN26308_c0_g1~~TRINITY_DN26308_c0_g1_i1.p1  ORF type:complete len:679 (+),score=179.93 TRINITY_DN26308_c0_g1_i1:71-2038(+)